jgi:hypothetical protein
LNSQTSSRTINSDVFSDSGRTSCHELAVIGNTSSSNTLHAGKRFPEHPASPNTRNPVPDSDDNISEGWQKVWSKSKGTHYYYNRRTGQSSWVPQGKDSAQSFTAGITASHAVAGRSSRGQTSGANSDHHWAAPQAAYQPGPPPSRHSLRQAAKTSHGRSSRQPSLLTVNEQQETA